MKGMNENIVDEISRALGAGMFVVLEGQPGAWRVSAGAPPAAAAGLAFDLGSDRGAALNGREGNHSNATSKQ